MHPISGGASFSLSSQTPSFTSYSSENIADIAARVVKELNLSQNDPFDDDYYSSVTFNDAFHDTPLNDTVQPQNDNINNDDEDDDDDDEEESEFEFAILTGEENSSPISADEIFDNGQIKPMFPVFNTDLVYGDNCGFSTASSPPTTIRVPLRKLLEERETSGNGAASCSSSEADDLEGVPPGTYCVWTPKKKEEVLMMKKKSKSTGSSKRWRFRDLLHRSNSDGKDTFVFLTPSNNHKSIGVGVGGGSSGGGDGRRREKTVTVGGRKKSGVEAGKMKSYLPYRQDLVGFFVNVNGISRTVRPF
ncbi:uncharacterized protein LOC110686737 [Chenopodium quinoa]|uniref:uncharacterized protein LOC110686737 n=1 Tax=Chenopodium quinoa TaxID=63459 RepID=UPI000B78361E|nr:uncharacterized protein LOC110686737 [Chenopodium quinoa]